MYGALSLGLALSSILALGPAETKTETDDALHLRPSGEQCHSEQLDFFFGFGLADAPTVMRVYLDPLALDPNPLRTWLELRRLAGERAGELRLELVPSRGGQASSDYQQDQVRVWFMAVASLGKVDEALRMLERVDPLRVGVQLRSEAGRTQLAAAVGLDPEAIEAVRTGRSGACLRISLDQASKHIANQSQGRPTALIGILSSDGVEQFLNVDAQLTEVRTRLDQTLTNPGFVEDAVGFVPFGPGLSGRSSRLDRTFPDTGVLAGGAALPHRLVIFVEDEEHGRLPDWLTPAMEFRANHPGQLSVQLIAGGVGTRAISLRRRLCAARTLGLEVEYLLHLAQYPSLRRLHEETLYEVLQPIADSDACSDEEPLEKADPETGEVRGGFGHPRGAWLDGRPVNPSDLQNLDYDLSTQLPPSLIDWLMTPDAFAQDPGGFEF